MRVTPSPMESTRPTSEMFNCSLYCAISCLMTEEISSTCIFIESTFRQESCCPAHQVFLHGQPQFFAIVPQPLADAGVDQLVADLHRQSAQHIGINFFNENRIDAGQPLDLGLQS